MTDSGKSLRLATGMAAGVNVILFLLIAWALAVERGLNPKGNLAALFSRPAEPEPEEILLVAIPEPLTPTQEDAAAENEKYRNTSPDAPEQEPDKDTKFVSDRSTRAASSLGPRPDGRKGQITQDGPDVASIDLRDASFRNGEAGAEASPATTPPEASPSAANAIGEEMTPPPVAFRDADTGIPVPMRTPEDRPPPPTPREERTPESGPSGIKARQDGDVDVQGPDALDAKAGPVAAYLKTLKGLYDRKFEEKRKSLGGILGRGLVEVEFDVDLTGRISNLRITNPGEATSMMQDHVLTIVLSTKLPPVPPEVASKWADFMVDGKMKRRLSFLRH